MEEENVETLEEENTTPKEPEEKKEPAKKEQDVSSSTSSEDDSFDDELDYGQNDSNEDFGKKEFEKTLENKNYYNEQANELAMQRQAAEDEADRDWKYEEEEKDNSPLEENSESQDEESQKENSQNEESQNSENNDDENQKESEDKKNEDQSADGQKKDSENSQGSQEQSNGPSGNKYVNEEEKNKNNDSENKEPGAAKENPENGEKNADENQDNNSEKKKVEKTEEDKKEDQNKLKQIKLAQVQNQINNVKSKAYQVLHPIEAAKAKAKAAIKKKIRDFIMRHPYIIVVASYVIFFFALLIIIICMMMAVLGGDDDSSGTYSNGLCPSSSNGSLVDFIYKFEGTTNTCTTTDNQPGYLAATLGGETVVTAGHGFTNYAVGSALSKSIIDTNNWSKYFQYNGATYYMMEGSCVPQKVMDKLSISSIEESYGASVTNDANSLGVTLTQYQLDALTDYAYNTGSAYAVISAYKEGGLEKMWEVMKETVYTQDGNIAQGLLSRRKAEIALFVTGDYTDQGKFYGRNYNYGTDEYNDYNSEKIVERQAECAALLTDVDGLVDVNGYKARLKRPQRTNSYFYVQDKDNYGRPSLEGECAWYARYRAEEILALAGSDKQILHSKNGGEYCDIPEANDGTFKKVTDYKKAKPGSLISWANDSYGHVAVVEMVDDEGITVSEGGIGTGYYIKEIGYDSWYMWDVFFPNSGNEEKARKDNCELNNSGCFSTRKIPWNQVEVNWGSVFQCYIYLLDN